MISHVLALTLIVGSGELALRSAIEEAESARPLSIERLNGAVLDYAQFLEQQGRYREAEPLLLRSVAINQNLHGRESLESALSILRIGALYHSWLRYGQAEDQTRLAANLLRSVAGDASLPYAYAIANLGTILAAQGENVRAEPLLRRAIYLMEQRDRGGASIAVLEVNLGLVHLRQGELRDAGRLLWSALIRRAGSCSACLAGLAELSIAAKRWTDARGQIEAAYTQTVRQSGEHSPELIGILHMRALVEASQGKLTAAAFDLERSISLTELIAGPESPVLLPLLIDYRVILRHSGRRREERVVTRRASLLTARHSPKL